MKTVFVTIFEGVEAKNILRTDIFGTLLSDPDVRTVLFVKNEARAEYYKKEFKDNDRILYEVVKQPHVKGWDKFFQRLKFYLLRTESTHVWRKMLFKRRKNLFLYYSGDFINWILARPLFVKISRSLDELLVGPIPQRNQTVG